MGHLREMVEGFDPRPEDWIESLMVLADAHEEEGLLAKADWLRTKVRTISSATWNLDNAFYDPIIHKLSDQDRGGYWVQEWRTPPHAVQWYGEGRLRYTLLDWCDELRKFVRRRLGEMT